MTSRPNTSGSNTSFRAGHRRFSTSSTISSHRISRRLSLAEHADHAFLEQSRIAPQQQAVTEEIAEIKRYEDFTTIDWVQDAAQEQLRRHARRQRNWELSQKGASSLNRNGHSSRLLPQGDYWRQKLWESYDAAQAWIVVTIVAVIIGVNAAVLNIITEYLSDLKMGYCTTAWYLNEGFCCYGAKAGCNEWRRWTPFGLVNYFIYAICAVLLACVAAFLVKAYAPYAAGSGISEIKCIIAGFVMKGFLGFWTFLIKSICLPIAIASGLSVGKEGPSVHYAVCVGNVVSRFFEKYRQSASKTREILTATAGAGVAVAFGSPIGGVLFSLEEMASHFPLKTLWRSYFCALVATAVLSAMNPFRTGQLVMFSVKYDRSWHYFEIVFYIVLGIFGGLYGAFMIKWNLKAQTFRKTYLSKYAIPEAMFLAGVTALFCYPNRFLRVDMTEMMEILFRECEGDYDYDGICEKQNRWSVAASLFLATVMRAFFVIISYGCKVPAGIFVPSMAIGASFGRMIGILVEWLHDTFPHSAFFSACQPDVPCITPGTYAFLGAGAALSGIMHITISVTVIMFELTGALTYILPTMIVVGVTKAVGDRFTKAGIADRMIWFNGFPFLDNKEEHIFGVPVSEVMTGKVASLSAQNMEFQTVQKQLNSTSYTGFPIVESAETKILVGYVGRTELLFAIERIRKHQSIPQDARCTFVRQTPSIDAEESSSPSMTEAEGPGKSASSKFLVDFSPYIDSTPITVHPQLPLETAMELFKKMGPRVILVEHHGRLEGLVTVKDCLKYQFKVEAMEHQAGSSGRNGTPGLGGLENAGDNGTAMTQILDVTQTGIDWFVDKLSIVSGGKIQLRLGSAHGYFRSAAPSIRPLNRGNGNSRRTQTSGPGGFADDYHREDEILDGTEEMDDFDLGEMTRHSEDR